MKRIRKPISILLVAAIVLLFAGCGATETVLNNTELSAYTIVYSAEAPDYCQRAAAYIHDQILSRTQIDLPVCEASSGTYEHEILVGDTDRAISKHLTAKSQNMEFAIASDENHIAMNADYFIIAAAAYYFVETYIPGNDFNSTVPREISIHTPITKAPRNFIFLIGDGMGVNHTKLFDAYDIQTQLADEDIFHDNEDIFYGYYLPYQGLVGTASLSGVTDSAAAATALACGYKTNNGYVGRNSALADVQSLTELAASKGMATAVLSTDDPTGATPAGFSAHADDRSHSSDIRECQAEKVLNGTVFECGLHTVKSYEFYINEALSKLEASGNGFFLMYEEGHIDKFSHNTDLQGAFSCVVRFNQVIGLFMEYAFYHPDTFLLITADHETGGLTFDSDGDPKFNLSSHTGADVPIFAYGEGAEYFDGFHDENIMIPKYIASLWGESQFGQID